MRPGDVIADRFELEQLAGTGGMGAVYRARERYSGKLVALKILQPGPQEHAQRPAAGPASAATVKFTLRALERARPSRKLSKVL